MQYNPLAQKADPTYRGSQSLLGQPQQQGGMYPPVTWDPASLAQNFWQPTFDPATTPRDKWGTRRALTTGAPARLEDFRREAGPLIDEKWRGSLLEQLSTMLSQQRTGEREQIDQLQMFGINPAAALGRLIPEQRQNSAEAQGALRGQAIAGQAGEQLGLSKDLLSAMNEIEAFYDSLNLQKTLADRARATARAGAKGAQLTSLVGGGLGALGLLGMGAFGGGGALAAGAGAGAASKIGGYNQSLY